MFRKLLIALALLVIVIIIGIVGVVLFVDPNDYRDEIAGKASEQLARPVALNGPLNFRVFPWIALEIKDVEVGNPPEFPADMPLANIGAAVASVRLSSLIRGKVDIGDIHLQDAHINALTLSGGRSNLTGLGGAGQAPTADQNSAVTDISQISTGAVSFSNLLLNNVDLASGERQTIAIDDIAVDPFRAGEDVDFSIRGKIVRGDEIVLDKLDIDGAINVAADLSAVQLAQFSLSAFAPAAAAEIDVSGAVNMSSLSPVRIHMPSLQAVIESAAQRLEIASAVDIQIEPVVAVTLDNGKVSLNGQSLAVSGGLRLAAAPSLDVRVSGEQLDLTAFMPANDETAADRGAASTAAGSASTSAQNAAATDLSWLRPWRIDAALDLQKLLLPDVELSNVQATLRARDGLITLNPLQARIFEGGFNGAASVDLRQDPPLVRLQPSLDGIAMQSMLHLLTDAVPCRGDGSLSLDLSFRGLNAKQAMESLDGQGQFTILDGALIGVDLNQVLNEELSRSNLTNISDAFGGETAFEQLQGSFSAQSGVITLPSVNMDTLQFGIRGNGSINLRQQALDYQMDLNLGEALRESLPERLVDATGGVIPLSVSGPMTAPIVTVNVENLVQRAVKKEARKQGRKLLDRLFNKDKDEEEAQDSAAEDDNG